jgi:hypothetical protein
VVGDARNALIEQTNTRFIVGGLHMPMAHACGGLVVAFILLGAAAVQGKDANTTSAELRIDAAAGETVTLPISPPAAEYRFARLTLPAQFSLSRGLKVGRAWFVSVADLPALALVPPQNFSGTARLELTFFREAKSDPSAPAFLVVAFTDQQANKLTNSIAGLAVSATEPQTALPLPPPRPISSEEAEALDRAAKLMRDGDVSSARLIYEELALKGSWLAARRLGETYDPVFLKRISQSGMKPSLVLARKWYAVAAGLGDREAAIRITASPSPTDR